MDGERDYHKLGQSDSQIEQDTQASLDADTPLREVTHRSHAGQFERVDEGVIPVREVGTQNGMDFGRALIQLRGGSYVARAGWNGKDMYIELVAGDPNTAHLPYIQMRTAQGEFVPWLASQADLLARDWRVVA
jgi:hypothetical protein